MGLALGLIVGLTARADITLLGTCALPADMLDRSGFKTEVVDGIPHAQLGSFGSGIDYTGKDDLYLAVDDRGPRDGAAPFRVRFQTFRIRIAPDNPTALRVSVEHVATTLLCDEHRQPLWGHAGAFDAADQRQNKRLDPEGIRVTPKGTILISEEYGPFLDEYAMDGVRLRRFEMPAKFMIDRPSDDPAREMPPTNTKGRQPNRGLEGLAIAPGGRAAYAILQSPLLQDGAIAGDGTRTGVNCRVIRFDLEKNTTSEFVYQLTSPKSGVCEMLAIDDHRFLVLERDGKGGSEAKSRGLYLVDVRAASDVSAIERLPSAGLPAGVVPMSKRPFIDFMDPKFHLAGSGMPEKIEGVTFGPVLADGRRTLIVTTDNDFLPDQPSWFWVFVVDAKDLQPQ